jgi:hypothetical protein
MLLSLQELEVVVEGVAHSD